MFLVFALTFKLLSFEMPAQFFVKQHWFSWTTTFDIESKDSKFGTVQRKILSLTPQYLFYDVNDQLQARAKMRFFSLGATFDIYDAEDVYLGKVDQRLLTFFSTFDLYRYDGYHAATAKLNFWGTKYTVKDPKTKEIIAVLRRSFFRLKDNWTVDVINTSLLAEKQIDPSMFVLVMAFQTDRDYWSKQGDQNGSHGINNCVEMQKIYHRLEKYRCELEEYRSSLISFEPNDADIEQLEMFVENHFSAECDWYDEDFDPEMHLVKIKEKRIGLLLPLLYSEELTIQQKSALFLFLEEELESI